ncbi:hypothetical protein C4572_01545 [Candidatus Parcubacteria bacterium]|nr:MAG: hypothetical protein C4572_01545 [Candidatus Parcubacteria bacterium]
MDFIINEKFPCWYELSWNKGTISLKISEEYLKKKPVRLESTTIVKGMKERFGFKEFFGDFRAKNFGFEGVFINNGVKSGSVIELKAVLPMVRQKPNFNYKNAYALSATFTLIFTYLFGGRKDIGATFSRFQLMTVETATEREMHGCGLCGQFSPQLVGWLKKIKDVEGFIYSIKKVTTKAYSCMDGKRRTFDSDFNLTLRDGRLIMGCPGNAAEIGPDLCYGEDLNHGYNFCSHNIDHPIQQLTLLAGLAALHDEARKAGV